MKPLSILFAVLLLPLTAFAQDAPPPERGIGPYSAAEVTLDEFRWLRRPVVVFADTPNDPNFRRQMQMIEADLATLDIRDVVVITDTDPASLSPIRRALRPRNFSLVLMDKDGEVKRRQPAAWSLREITHAIDRFPLRREEMLERNPAGR